tara:strand:- start:118 stop:456 length:339 start_codon:yes stop_codon:yes gene_type:complete
MLLVGPVAVVVRLGALSHVEKLVTPCGSRHENGESVTVGQRRPHHFGKDRSRLQRKLVEHCSVEVRTSQTVGVICSEERDASVPGHVDRQVALALLDARDVSRVELQIVPSH